MNKFLLSLCAVVMLSVTLTLGGVFALFGYAQSDAEPVSKNVNTQLEEFVYGDYPAGFTSGMKAVLDVAETDTTYGLNASGHDAGMRKAMVLSTIVSARHGYGYVGTMDKTYGNDVYGKDAVENISVVITFANDIDGVQTIYMYFVKKSKAELAEMEENHILDNVFRATFIKDAETANDWDLRRLPNGSPDVVKGSSLVKNYEGQTDGAKTFGFHNKTEIWQAD